MKSSLNLLDKLYGDIVDKVGYNIEDYGAGEIVRYAGKAKIKEETVAEHSFMCAMIVIRVGAIMELPKIIINEAVTRAILHDLPEQYFGDLSYDFKSKPEFKSTVKSMEDRFNQMLYQKKYKEELGEVMYDTMFNTNDPAGRLVKLADTISVLQYAYREYQLGNEGEHVKYMIENTLGRIKYDLARLLEVLEEDY